jgi:hypothetical protein
LAQLARVPQRVVVVVGGGLSLFFLTILLSFIF